MWDDDPTADPIGDIRRMTRAVYDQHGYNSTQIFMTAEAKETYERFVIWHEITVDRLLCTPRWRWMTRLVLQRQIRGPWIHRQHWYLRYRLWKSRNEIDF